MKTILLIIIFLTGCTASGVYVSEVDAVNFQKGKTTLDEVLAQLGDPVNKTIKSNGDIFITYAYTEAKARPETYIPYIGALVGGADAMTTATVFRFDDSGILKDYTFSETKTGTKNNLSVSPPDQRYKVNEPK